MSSEEKITVLLVDDDPFVRKTIAEYLTRESFDVLEAQDGQDAQQKIIAHGNSISIILLDMILPDCDGLNLIPKVKNIKDIPIIIISSRGDDVDRIIGIEAGADDYVVKPVTPRELKARINAVLKRFSSITASDPLNVSEDATITFDKWEVTPSQYQVFNKKGESANLTTSEFLILYNLVLSPNKVLSREHLFEITRQVNSDTFDRAVDVQITRIRKKLGDSAKAPKYIKTVRGVGYIFCCPTNAQ